METKTFWIVLLFFVVAVTFFPIFQGKFYAAGDMRDIFIPLENFFRQEMLNFRLPAWNPNIAWGYPVIASAQIGFFYPPSLILRLLPLWLFFPLLLLGHFIALACGTFLFSRALKATAAAAYLASISFALGSFVIQHLTHLNVIITATWLPWQLLVIHNLATKPKITARHIASLGLMFGLPFLAGQLHIPTMMALVSAAYFLYLRRQRRLSLTKSATLLLTIASLALLISAAQLFPTLELVMQSSRGPAGDFDLLQANQYSFPVYHLPTLLFPRFYGNDSTYWGKRIQVEYGFFIGTIPIILALWFIVTSLKIENCRARRSLWRRLGKLKIAKPQSSFWFFLLIITFLLALGSLSPFRLLGFEPSLWIFSAPTRWLLFTTFSLALFAAKGFDQLPKHTRSFRRFAVTSAIIITAIAIAGTAILFTADEARLKSLAATAFWGNLNRPPTYYTDKLNSLFDSARASSVSLASPATALPTIILVALPFLITKKRGFSVILAITTVELIIIAATTNPTTPWSKILTRPDTVSALPASVQTSQARLVSFRPAGDTGQYFTNPATRANSVQREELHQLLAPLGHSIFNIPSIEWPASLHLAHHADYLDQIRGSKNLWLKDISRAEQLNIDAVLVPARLASPQINRPYTTVNNINIYQLTPSARASTEGTATYHPINASHTKITVDAPTNTTLIIRDSYYPGWRAYVDDHQTPITKADTIFRQLDIPAGQHTVDMYYRPITLYFGLATSALALCFCGLTLLNKRNT